MKKEMWTNGKMDQARYTRIPGLNLVTLGCVGIPRKPIKSANEAQKAEADRAHTSLEGSGITQPIAITVE